MKNLIYLLITFISLSFASCSKEDYKEKAFVDREFYFNDEIYRVDVKKSSWVESQKYYQCPTIGTPVVFYVEFAQKPTPGRYDVKSFSERNPNQASMTITKWDLNTGILQTWKSKSGDLRINIIDSVLVDNKPIQLVKFEFGGPVYLEGLNGEVTSTTGIFYAKN